ncbi:uncharacterized protein LOC130679589 [Manis pentadactyla]|uniref:uncharacterized protein LOC130679589 n=1 Tax=Manis pentadactyla TaxID=143292 RepID=UPI00255CADBB|nr:uncharacterized protein LOC130679589 [Manis pentadactyla]
MFIRIKFYLSLHRAQPPPAAAGCHCPARVGTGRASGPGARGGARAGLTQARTQTPPGWVGHRELYLLGVIATVSSRRHRSHWATSPTERHRPGSTCNKPTRPQPELHSRLAGSRTSWPVTAGPVLRPHAAPLPSPPAPPHPLLLLNKCAPCCPGVAEAVSVRRLRLREPFVHEMLQHPIQGMRHRCQASLLVREEKQHTHKVPEPQSTLTSPTCSPAAVPHHLRTGQNAPA